MIDSPIGGKTLLLKFRPRCVPAPSWNLGLDTNLYRNQYNWYQGLPSREKVSSGSMLNLPFCQDILKIAAGFSREKLGIREIPLLVIPTEPDKTLLRFVLSLVCAKEVQTKPRKQKSRIELLVFMCTKIPRQALLHLMTIKPILKLFKPFLSELKRGFSQWCAWNSCWNSWGIQNPGHKQPLQWSNRCATAMPLLR